MTSNGDSPEQLTLLRDTVRKSRIKEPAGITETLPVARIAVDVSLPHLDRPFDYLVPEDLAAAAQPGARVKVRFAGKDLDGFVLERLESSDHEGKLVRIRKVVSPEQVLKPEIADLCRAVADRYAGVFADVTRLAVPPRHAKVEGEALRCNQPAPPPVSTSRSEWSQYPAGFLDAIARSESPRAIWTAVPGADWPLAFAQAAAVCAASGRGRCCWRRMRVISSGWRRRVRRCSGMRGSSRCRRISGRPLATAPSSRRCGGPRGW